MTKEFCLREITEKDWEILLEWRNDSVTRRNFHRSDLVEVEEKGFEKEVCDQVRKTLDKISNAFAAIPDNFLFRQAIYKRMESL